MTDVSKSGTAGKNGADATATKGTGGDGGNGQHATASSTGASQTSNTAEASGGSGGNGGAGGPGPISGSVFTGLGGPGGDGGNGGYAVATASVTAGPGDGSAFASGQAGGGRGGNAGDYGVPQPDASHPPTTGADGGNGAAARSTVTATGADGAQSTSQAAGGSGGAGDGPNHEAGDGAMATATASAAATGSGASASVSAIETSGSGGSGYYGATGGHAAACTMTDAVKGSTKNGSLRLEQDVHAGNGGGAYGGGNAQVGAAAISSLTTKDGTNANKSASIAQTVLAQGGNGGSTDTSQAAAGGKATAISSVAALKAFQTYANAFGGAGGFVADGGDASGGDGGDASATSNGSGYGGDATTFCDVEATATAGDGGAADGSGRTGGDGGIATAAATASTRSAGNLTVQATAVSGTGGSGVHGANGGAGGSTSISNAVAGTANGGSLSLAQSATGGKGGASYDGIAGHGGAATSSLTFDETRNSYLSQGLSVSITAQGGTGGQGQDVSKGGVGGNATAYAAAVSTRPLTVTADGYGGFAGLTDATGLTSNYSGAATSRAKATGVSGTFKADAYTTPGSGALVTDMTDEAFGVVDGTAATRSTGTAISSVAVGGAAPAVSTAYQAYSRFASKPLAADTSTVVNSNHNIKTALGSRPAYIALGELGGAYDVNGHGSETVTASAEMHIDPTKLGRPQDLEIGLYNGTSFGSGVTSVRLDIYVGSSQAFSQTFASGAAAKRFMTDRPLDLGAMSSSPFDLQIVLNETIGTASSNFYTGILVGNGTAPAHAASAASAQTAPSQAGLAQSLFDAAFGGAPSLDTAGGGHAHQTDPVNLGAAGGRGSHPLWSALHGHA